MQVTESASASLGKLAAAWRSVSLRAGAAEDRCRDGLGDAGPRQGSRGSRSGTRASTAAIDVSQSALELELRHRPPAEIDRARFELWVHQLVVDATARDADGVRGDLATLEWIRDRFAVTIDKVDLARIDAQLVGLSRALNDDELPGVAAGAARLRATLANFGRVTRLRARGSRAHIDEELVCELLVESDGRCPAPSPGRDPRGSSRAGRSRCSRPRRCNDSSLSSSARDRRCDGRPGCALADDASALEQEPHSGGRILERDREGVGDERLGMRPHLRQEAPRARAVDERRSEVDALRHSTVRDGGRDGCARGGLADVDLRSSDAAPAMRSRLQLSGRLRPRGRGRRRGVEVLEELEADRAVAGHHPRSSDR